jgi:hypothetical protein
MTRRASRTRERLVDDVGSGEPDRLTAAFNSLLHLSSNITAGDIPMGGIAALSYGVIVYLVFLATFPYSIAFVGNFGVPKTIDSGEAGALGAALAIDTLLLAVFAIQHSVMARAAFKRWWTRLVPHSVERTTYVLFASLALVLLYWQWRPIPEPV